MDPLLLLSCGCGLRRGGDTGGRGEGGRGRGRAGRQAAPRPERRDRWTWHCHPAASGQSLGAPELAGLPSPLSPGIPPLRGDIGGRRGEEERCGSYQRDLVGLFGASAPQSDLEHRLLGGTGWRTPAKAAALSVRTPQLGRGEDPLLSLTDPATRTLVQSSNSVLPAPRQLIPPKPTTHMGFWKRESVGYPQLHLLSAGPGPVVLPLQAWHEPCLLAAGLCPCQGGTTEPGTRQSRDGGRPSASLACEFSCLGVSWVPSSPSGAPVLVLNSVLRLGPEKGWR